MRTLERTTNMLLHCACLGGEQVEGKSMGSVLRSLSAIAAGLVFAFALVVAVELFSAVVHPFPEDFTGSQEEVCQHVERYPAWVLAVAAAAWAGLSLVSTWTAARLGYWWCGLAVGLLLVAALILNLSMLPYPIWFKAGTLIAIPVAVAGGITLASRPRAAIQVDHSELRSA